MMLAPFKTNLAAPGSTWNRGNMLGYMWRSLSDGMVFFSIQRKW